MPTSIARHGSPGLYLAPMTPSRRDLLQGAAVAALSALDRTAAPAQSKSSQQAAEYQPTAKYGQSCAMCQLFRPPGACQVVAGVISPQGWCKFFSLPD